MKDWFKYLKQPRTLAITVAVVVVLAIMIPAVILLRDSVKADTGAGTDAGGVITLIPSKISLKYGDIFTVRISADTRGAEVYEIRANLSWDEQAVRLVAASYPNSSLWPELYHDSHEAGGGLFYVGGFTISRSVPKDGSGQWPTNGQSGQTDLAVATFRVGGINEDLTGYFRTSNEFGLQPMSYGEKFYSGGNYTSGTYMLGLDDDTDIEGTHYLSNYLSEASPITVQIDSTSNPSSASGTTNNPTTSSNTSSTSSTSSIPTSDTSSSTTAQPQTASQAESVPLSDSGPEMIVWYGASALSALFSTLTFRRWKN